MPDLGTIELGTSQLGTPSTQSTATLTASGARATATGATASLVTQGTFTATGATAIANPGGASLTIEDQTASELGTGELGTGMLGVASKPDAVTMTAQGATAAARGATADLFTSTTLTASGTTATATSPGALLDTISGGMLGTGELGGGMLGASTGASGVIMTAQGATATAAGDSANLISLDLPDVAAPSQGWHVELDHANGRTIEPQLLDDPSFTPALKDYPRVEIPVPRDETWQAEAFEEATLRVWKDGDIRPIDTLVDIQMEPGRTVLIGRGGHQLTQRVQYEADDEFAHEVAHALGDQHTDYAMHVDDPSEPFASNKLLQAADTNSDLRDALLAPIDTDPVKIENGQLQLLQSCFTMDTFEETSRNVDTLYLDNDKYGEYSGGNAVGLRTTGSYIEYTFTTEYEIPAEHFWIAVRWEKPNVERGPDLEVRLDGEVVIDHGGDRGGFNLFWFGQSDDYRSSEWSNPSSNIQPGTHTVRFEVVGDGNQDLILDCHAPFDGRYTYTWDNDNGGDAGYLDGPELKPDAHDVVFGDPRTAFNIPSGRLDAVLDNTTGEQALALSNDRGETYHSTSNTDSLSADFDGAGSSLRWTVTLSRYGSQTGATPKQGINGQSLDSFEVHADLEDTPVLTETSYDGSLKDVFNQIADYMDGIWELRRQSVDDWSIEWTQPGQRETTADDSIVEYSLSKSTASQYSKAVIKGSSQPVRGERVTAQYDEWVALDHGRVLSGSDTVRDPDSGESFEDGVDYDLDRSEGRIKVLSGGAMTDDTVCTVDYRYEPQGEYVADDAGSDPETIVRKVPSITSNRGCEQAALYLVRTVKEPLWEAEVTVPTADAGRSLVDDLLLEDLPTQERMEVREVQQTPQEVVLRLGSRQSVGEVINDIQSRISSVSDRV
jgi:hypothetical protein